MNGFTHHEQRNGRRQDRKSFSSFPTLEDLRDIAKHPEDYVGPTDESNWVIPGLLLVGAYPCSMDDVETWEILRGILVLKVTTFVCLQQEYVHEGVTEQMWRSGEYLRPYFKDAVGFAPRLGLDAASLSLLHFPIEDCGTADDDRLAALAHHLVSLLAKGEVMYLHCWGGHGRTGTVICLLLHLMYNYTADQAFERCQYLHDLRRIPVAVGSPQTQGQREQVRRVIEKLKRQAREKEKRRQRQEQQQQQAAAAAAAAAPAASRRKAPAATPPPAEASGSSGSEQPPADGDGAGGGASKAARSPPGTPSRQEGRDKKKGRPGADAAAGPPGGPGGGGGMLFGRPPPWRGLFGDSGAPPPRSRQPSEQQALAAAGGGSRQTSGERGAGSQPPSRTGTPPPTRPPGAKPTGGRGGQGAAAGAAGGGGQWTNPHRQLAAPRVPAPVGLAAAAAGGEAAAAAEYAEEARRAAAAAGSPPRSALSRERQQQQQQQQAGAGAAGQPAGGLVAPFQPPPRRKPRGPGFRRRAGSGSGSWNGTVGAPADAGGAVETRAAAAAAAPPSSGFRWNPLGAGRRPSAAAGGGKGGPGAAPAPEQALARPNLRPSYTPGVKKKERRGGGQEASLPVPERRDCHRLRRQGSNASVQGPPKQSGLFGSWANPAPKQEQPKSGLPSMRLAQVNGTGGTQGIMKNGPDHANGAATMGDAMSTNHSSASQATTKRQVPTAPAQKRSTIPGQSISLMRRKREEGFANRSPQNISVPC